MGSPVGPSPEQAGEQPPAIAVNIDALDTQELAYMFCALQEPVLTYDETGSHYEEIERSGKVFERELARDPARVKAVFEYMINGRIDIQRWWAVSRSEMYAKASPDTVVDFWEKLVQDDNKHVVVQVYEKLTGLFDKDAYGASYSAEAVEKRLRRAGLTLLEASRLALQASQALWAKRDAVAATALNAMIEHPQPPEVNAAI
jgi:hypothetical protein